MRIATLTLLLAAALAGSAQAQTATPAPAAAPAAAAPAGHERLSHDCKEEVHKVCGRAHGDEMQNCIKSSLDLNKFSAACKTELTQAAKPGG